MKTYSSGDVARMCDVTSRTVMRWITAGRLKAFKLPGRGNNRVHEDDLIAFLKQNQIPLPEDLQNNFEQVCFIISEDKHTIRHVKRIVRDADYDVRIHQSAFSAGFDIARTKPTLLVLDCDGVDVNVKELISHFEKNSDYKPILLAIGLDDQQGTLAQYSGESRVFQKPLDLHEFVAELDEIIAVEA